MKKVFIILALCLSVIACNDANDHPERVAGETAVAYYNLLQSGKYADYVSGMVNADSLPPAYREQLEANAAMFVEQQEGEHGGLKAFSLQRSELLDSLGNRACAFLNVEYKDGYHELIAVEMVRQNELWYMK